MTKTAIYRNLKSIPRKSVWRFAWALLLLMHVPATIKVFSVAFGAEANGSSWPSVLLITATNLFFLVEIIFACSLKLLSNRRSVIVFLLIIALLHVGVIGSGFPDLAQALDLRFWMLLSIGSLALWQLLSAVSLAISQFIPTILAEDQRQHSRCDYAAAVAPIHFAGARRMMVRTLPDRAPPARA